MWRCGPSGPENTLGRAAAINPTMPHGVFLVADPTVSAALKHAKLNSASARVRYTRAKNDSPAET